MVKIVMIFRVFLGVVWTSVAFADGWERMSARYERGAPEGIYIKENGKSLDVLRLSCAVKTRGVPSPVVCEIVKMIVYKPDARGQCHVELEAEAIELERKAKNEWIHRETLSCNGSRSWRAKWEKIPKRACENGWDLDFEESFAESNDSGCAGVKRRANAATYRGADNCSTPLPQECKTIVVGHGQKSGQ